jgi:hypothetical protein
MIQPLNILSDIGSSLAEDYQGARLYKLWSRNLLDLAGEIEELELEKLRAVEIEDFDEAERLKVELGLSIA